MILQNLPYALIMKRPKAYVEIKDCIYDAYIYNSNLFPPEKCGDVIGMSVCKGPNLMVICY